MDQTNPKTFSNLDVENPSLAGQGLPEAPVHTLDSEDITRLFQGRFGLPGQMQEPKLESVFGHILRAANRYAPSEAGSIAIVQGPSLRFVASFGEGSELLVGTSLPSETGIMGRAFRDARPIIANDVQHERDFFPGIDQLTHSITHSLMSTPIVLDETTVGVLSLRNRLSPKGFRTSEMRLMEIFCNYLSTSIQNLLDYLYQQELALKDHLTGLRNDRFFYRQLLHEIAACERNHEHLCLIFLDLDHFKGVVDTHGHLVGSQVIAQVGQLLGRTVLHARATLARYGGDEYVIVLPNTSRQEAAELAENVRKVIVATTYLTEPLADGTPALNLRDCFTASVGVAAYHDCATAGLGPEACRHLFIRTADEAMYKAKSRGKNCVYVHGQDA
jgi:diguanylate cyclase (GGDEF)-like protein